MLELKEIMNTLGSVHAGIAMGHGVLINKIGVWSASQSVVAYFPFKGERECSLDLKTTKNALSVLNDVQYEWKDSELLLKSGRVKVKLPYVPNDKGNLGLFKKLSTFRKKDKWLQIPEQFNDAIALCSRSISDDAMLGTLTCFNIDGSTIITSNNVTVTRFDLGTDFANSMVNKPALIAALAINPDEYLAMDGSLVFRNSDGVMIRIPVVKGSYPDFSPILQATPNHTIEVDNEQLAHIADLTEKLFDGGNIMDNSIVVEGRDRKLIVSNKSQQGAVRAVMNMNFDGTFKFTIDSNTLRLLVNTSASIGINDNAVIVESENIKLVAAVGGA